jgi:hypothetical protein
MYPATNALNPNANNKIIKTLTFFTTAVPLSAVYETNVYRPTHNIRFHFTTLTVRKLLKL